MGAHVATGELADYREARTDDGPALFKLPRRPADNDLLRREATALRQVARTVHPRHRAVRSAAPRHVHPPRPEHRSGPGGQRLRPARRLRRLASIRAEFPAGIDPRDAAWMWRRLLVALGWAHRAGVVHGAVLPEHVLIQPEEHGLVLVDWCYAAVAGRRPVPALVAGATGTGIRRRSPRADAHAGTDIYHGDRCMAALIGDRAPAALRPFAVGCLRPRRAARPQDAWHLLAELDELLEKRTARGGSDRRIARDGPAWPRQFTR